MLCSVERKENAEIHRLYHQCSNIRWLKIEERTMMLQAERRQLVESGFENAIVMLLRNHEASHPPFTQS